MIQRYTNLFLIAILVFHTLLCIFELCNRHIGGQSCTLTRTVSSHPSSNGSAVVTAYFGASTCTGATGTITGSMTVGIPVSDVTMAIYANVTAPGTYNISTNTVNGVTFSGTGTFTSTGCQLVTLTASGTPTACGANISWITNTTPNITSTICGIACTPTATTVNPITSPRNSSIWMDRNLGATTQATNINVATAYGDLYQWGRATDGHQFRTSGTTSTLSPSITANSSCFITTTGNWISIVDNNLWQGVSGVNNPCPSGYRLPTAAEFLAAMPVSGTCFSGLCSIALPYSAALYIPIGGYRGGGAGNLINVGTVGQPTYYWTSNSASNTTATAISVQFAASLVAVAPPPTLTISSVNINKGTGAAVRCIKD